MNERTHPYCLLGALIIPGLWMGFLTISLFMHTFFPDNSGGHVGDNNMGGIGIVIGAIAFSIVAGVVLSIASYFRDETLLGQGIGVWAGCVLIALFGVMIGVTVITQHGRGP